MCFRYSIGCQQLAESPLDRDTFVGLKGSFFVWLVVFVWLVFIFTLVALQWSSHFEFLVFVFKKHSEQIRDCMP